MRHDTSRHDAEILHYVSAGGVVVAANARAARALERAHSIAQQELGHQAWSAPMITTWQIWLEQLWQQHLFNTNESRLLLNNPQERLIWRRIVARDSAAQQVLSLDKLAALAQEAYTLLGEYDAHSDRNRVWGSDTSAHPGKDAETFRAWAAAFDRECGEHNWLSRSHLPAEISALMRHATVTVTKEIRTLGFDRFTPAQQRLLDAAKNSGCLVISYEPHVFSSRSRLCAARDRRSEIDSCAHWLRKRLLENPGGQFAVVVPDVQSIRGELDRVFRRVLMPGSMYLAYETTRPELDFATVPVTEEDPVFEFSLGTPLALVPIVRLALLLLRWMIDPLREDEITWLLLSGFLTQTEADVEQLARIEARVRSQALLPPEVELTAFLKQQEHAESSTAQRIVLQLSRLSSAALKGGTLLRERSSMEWAEESQRLLRVAGWPGDQPQSSRRFQALQKWEQLLAQAASLNFDGSRMSYREFLTIVEGQASETTFAPESHDAPVQIVGPFESSGQTFDAIWFMGAEEAAWPAPGSPNSLIPAVIRRKAGLPHASLESDWELAHAATQRIAGSAPESVFSYARQNQDGDLRISPLLSEVLGTPPQRIAPESFVPWQNNATVSVAIEKIEESAPVPWPRARTAGGASVLTSQSACAFQAFASKRLLVEPLGCAEWGLTALVRGDLMHQVLDNIWCGEHGLGSLEGLQAAIVRGEVDPLLTNTVEEVFAGHPATRSAEGWTQAYLETEKLRIKKLLSQWLHYEAGRRAFEVEGCEQKNEDFLVGDLRLRVRIDRIDRLANGEKLLIDYKSGVVSAKKWECPRPEEPQLPLYATFGGLGQISGLLFAQIRAGCTEFKGQSTAPGELVMGTMNGKSAVSLLSEEDWDSWQSELLRLSEDFLRGEAAVAPKSYPTTCTYCGMQGLCRVAVTSVPLRAADADASDENGQADSE